MFANLNSERMSTVIILLQQRHSRKVVSKNIGFTVRKICLKIICFRKKIVVLLFYSSFFLISLSLSVPNLWVSPFHNFLVFLSSLCSLSELIFAGFLFCEL